MSTTPDIKHLNRRQFLRLAGLTAGGLLAGTLLPPGTAHASRLGGPAGLGSRPGLGGQPAPGATWRVGVLLPASTVYPDLGRNFLAGLQLAAEGRSWDIVAREIGAGATGAYAMAQQ